MFLSLPCPILFNIARTLCARVQQVGLQYLHDSTRVKLGMVGD